MYRLLLLSCLLLVACDSPSTFNSTKKDPQLNPLSEIRTKLAFNCKHEQIPEVSADSEILFLYARWLQKNNQLKQDKSVDAEIERLYRTAAENGHHKANINLQNGAMRGQFTLRGEEHLRMSQRLINAGVATGYYFVGVFLRQGSAGLKQDTQMSLRYYRKAADEGSAQAQYYVGDKLAWSDAAPDISRQMRRCAAEQGHGEAAKELGVNLQGREQFQEALEAFQLGVAAGNSSSASVLSNGFLSVDPSDALYYLGQHIDLERASRYRQIRKVLSNYSYANPKVPEINEIVPLPPAKLPAWDGKLKWLEERQANVPPEKPREALIRQLAKAKLLDPASGRPLPNSPDFIQASVPRPTCNSGQACPQAGYWEAVRVVNTDYVLLKDAEPHRFEKGELMPTLRVQSRHSRFLFADRISVQEENIEWRLLGEA